MRLTLENLYAKFGLAGLSGLAVALPNSPGCPKMQNFETLFSQLWCGFLSLWVVVPLWNFGIMLVHIIWVSKSNLMKLANLFFVFCLKMSRIGNYKILKKIQNGLTQKLLNSGFWNFTCRFMWGASLFMPNFMNLTVIEEQIWPKNPNFGFLRCFMGVFCKKTVLKI